FDARVEWSYCSSIHLIIDQAACGKTGYYLPRSVQAIQREIMKRGPVTAGYTIYADFLHYRRGIYKRIAGKTIGGHSVKIVGWGKERHIPYWIVANSWGTGWGEEAYLEAAANSYNSNTTPGIAIACHVTGTVVLGGRE
ncbi:papain family cysteine protease, partial [Teladorsagia circumcincta]